MAQRRRVNVSRRLVTIERYNLNASTSVGSLSCDTQALVKSEYFSAGCSTVARNVAAVQTAVPDIVVIASPRFVKERSLRFVFCSCKRRCAEGNLSRGGGGIVNESVLFFRLLAIIRFSYVPMLRLGPCMPPMPSSLVAVVARAPFLAVLVFLTP